MPSTVSTYVQGVMVRAVTVLAGGCPKTLQTREVPKTTTCTCVATLVLWPYASQRSPMFRTGGPFFRPGTPSCHRLGNLDIPAEWDEAGDVGRVSEFDPVSGKLRWKAKSGVVPDVSPTVALVRSDTVTVSNDLGVTTLTIESGGISVAESGVLRSSNRIEVQQNAMFAVNGTVDCFRMTVQRRRERIRCGVPLGNACDNR